jgi:hypothetical protein
MAGLSGSLCRSSKSWILSWSTLRIQDERHPSPCLVEEYADLHAGLLNGIVRPIVQPSRRGAKPIRDPIQVDS